MKKQNMKNIIEFEMNLYEELNDCEGRHSLYKQMDKCYEGVEIEVEG